MMDAAQWIAPDIGGKGNTTGMSDAVIAGILN